MKTALIEAMHAASSETLQLNRPCACVNVPPPTHDPVPFRRRAGGDELEHGSGLGAVLVLEASHRTLPYPTLPYPTLPYPTVPYPALPHPTLRRT